MRGTVISLIIINTHARAYLFMLLSVFLKHTVYKKIFLKWCVFQIYIHSKYIFSERRRFLCTVSFIHRDLWSSRYVYRCAYCSIIDLHGKMHKIFVHFVYLKRNFVECSLIKKFIFWNRHNFGRERMRQHSCSFNLYESRSTSKLDIAANQRCLLLSQIIRIGFVCWRFIYL